MGENALETRQLSLFNISSTAFEGPWVVPLNEQIQESHCPTGAKDGSHNWGEFAHIQSMVGYYLGAHFMKVWDPSFGKMQKDILMIYAGKDIMH